MNHQIIKNMEKETIIGIIYDWDDTDLVSLKDVDKEEYDLSYPREQLLDKDCDEVDYCQGFTRFNYDPFTGEKINWDELKKSI